MVTLKESWRRIRCWLRIGLSGSKLERIRNDDVGYLKELINLIEDNPVDNQKWLASVGQWSDFEAVDDALSSLTVRLRDSVRVIEDGGVLPVVGTHRKWVNAQDYYSIRGGYYIDVQQNLDRFVKAVKAFLEVYQRLSVTDDVRASLNHQRLSPLMEEVRSVLTRWLYSQI